MYIEDELIKRYRDARLSVVADALIQLTTKADADSLSVKGILHFIIDMVDDRNLAKKAAKRPIKIVIKKRILLFLNEKL